MKTVIVVESPAKAKKIQKFFKNDTIVTSSFGHIYDLSKKTISIDTENNFKPKYQPIDGKQKIIKSLKDLSNNNKILLAADDDREGDAIAWHCGKVMKLKTKDKNRIIFREVSEKAIKKAIENVHTLNMNSVNAQQGRRIIDRLVGFSLSPCLWKHIQTKKQGLSAGRVQSTLLSILKDHENEIENHESEYSYDFRGSFNFDQKNTECELLFEIEEIEPIEIMKILKKDRKYKIIESKESEEKKYPCQPLITSSLQQSAQNELGFPVKMTMDIAQKLFDEKGVNGVTGIFESIPLPFPDDHFDAIFTYETIEHIPWPDEYITELARLTKSGGLIVLTTPNLFWEPIHLLAPVLGLHHSEGPHKMLSRGRLRSLFQKNELQILKEKTFVLIPAGPKWLLNLGRKIERLLPDWLLEFIALRQSFVCIKNV